MQLDYGTHGHKGLSYSRLGAFHTCGRLFQLEHALGYASRKDTVTFSFGHACGAGVQEYLLHGSEELAVLAAARHYTMDWGNPGTIKEQRARKSVWWAMEATQTFIQRYNSKLPNELDALKDYELAHIQLPSGETVPAVELQFRILLEDDYVYEGHIDLILRHKISGEYAVVELKTTSFKDVPDAVYQNSNQALGYAIVLDKILHGLAQTSYKVLYLVYSCPQRDWVLRSYPKEVKRRFDWINNLVRDAEIIEYYQQAAEEGVPYPTNGANCYQFFENCKYFGTCHMDDESLGLMYKSTSKEEAQFADEDNAHFIISLEEIIETQVKLAEDRAGLTGLESDTIEVIQEI